MQDYMDKMTEQRKQSRSKFVQLPRTIKSPKSEKKNHPACRSGCYIYAASLFHNTSYWCVLSMAINKMRYEIMMSTSFFRWLHVSRQFSCSHTLSLSANEQTFLFSAGCFVVVSLGRSTNNTSSPLPPRQTYTGEAIRDANQPPNCTVLPRPPSLQASCYLHLFSKLKKRLKDQRFVYDEVLSKKMPKKIVIERFQI